MHPRPFRPNKPRSETVKVLTLFDAAKSYRTASFFWPASENPDHNIPFVLESGHHRLSRGARENEVFIDFFFSWYSDLPLQVTSDRILTRAAVHVIEKYKPQLLAIRLPAMDRYQHEYGPDHYLAKAAFTAADYNVGLIRRATERAGIANETTFVIVSDHGSIRSSIPSTSTRYSNRQVFSKKSICTLTTCPLSSS